MCIRDRLRAYLEKLVRPIELIAFVDASAASQELRALLADVAELSDKIALRAGATAGERVPSFAIAASGEAPRIRFAGLPMGHEFTSLVLALLHTGGHPPKAEAEVQEQIRALNAPLRFETYISLTCHNCPEVVQSLNLMAALNPQIGHVMSDGALFQDEVNQRQIMAVPNLWLNGEPFAQGRMELSLIHI